MSEAEKRSVHTDALATLGTIISENEKRDAIHLAVENTIAAEKLFPGQDVGVDGTTKNPVGIVDPFLKKPVMVGERFWLIVYPRQITSLRHVWEHPSFPDSKLASISISTKQQSEAWLRIYLSTQDIEYDDFMKSANRSFVAPDNKEEWYFFQLNDDGSGLISIGRDAYGEIPSEFWNHLENVTGKAFVNKATYFSCSC